MDRDLDVKFNMIVIIQDGLPTLRRNLSRRRGRRAATYWQGIKYRSGATV